MIDDLGYTAIGVVVIIVIINLIGGIFKFLFGSSNGSASSSNSRRFVKNRCYPCKYYGGSRGNTAICDAGNKGVLTRNGCSSFVADITASCNGGEAGCWYNKNGTSAGGIDCSIYGKLTNTRDHCSDCAMKESE